MEAHARSRRDGPRGKEYSSSAKITMSDHLGVATRDLIIPRRSAAPRSGEEATQAICRYVQKHTPANPSAAACGLFTNPPTWPVDVKKKKISFRPFPAENEYPFTQTKTQFRFCFGFDLFHAAFV